MAAYYNEIDPAAAAWIRQLVKEGHVAPGDVDERSIVDVQPSDLKGYTQCHFFAGIGVWSYALRQAGWPDDAPVWTGSCPCQPFSSAGSGKGVDDERHLWPHFFRLIKECRPVTCFGEQVANKPGESWFDIVQADLETENYASGMSVFPACGVGAPHMRKRLYWVAEDILADPREYRLQKPIHSEKRQGSGIGVSANISETSQSADTDSQRQQGQGQVDGPSDTETREDRQEHRTEHEDRDNRPRQASPTNGLWRDADWLFCRDGKWRPVEPGTFPLANGSSARVGRLRGYGNAIVAPQAVAFIEAYLDVCEDRDTEK